MGIFDWFIRLITGAPPRPQRRFFQDGVCPYCGEELRTRVAQQCFACGVAWHDPDRPVQLGSPSPVREVPAASEVTVAASSAAGGVSQPRGPEKLAGLELGNLAPATHDEVREGAKQVGSLWGNPWFGRRDVIPPLSDKRTALVDRGMIGQGMITAEELEEIHRIGEEMDRIRPDLAQARGQAEAAVARDQQQREAIKQQKKAEAAERKRKHAETVAHRRATDIVYLGRGVSAGLADRRANVERLAELGLPVLATPGEVAAAIQIDIPHLRWLAFHSDASKVTHYVNFTVPKRSGGERNLSAPHKRLRQTQEWILDHVLSRVPPHKAAHGFVPGRSTLTNAQPHVGRDVVINADLEDFFPTITFGRVKGVFRSLGYSPAVATIFALLCSESPRRQVKYQGQVYHAAIGPRALPQGACTSPAISNLAARRLDKRLTGLADKLGWSYTRYADDLTLSTSGEAAGNVGYVLARLRHISDDEGFAVNERKTRVQRPNTRQSVTGVVVNDRPGAPRPLVRRLRAILHRARHEGLAAQNRDNQPNFEAWLSGMIAYVTMLNPQQGEKLHAAYQEVS